MVGCVLAGGAGSRLGGDKARADLLGRPLIAWPLAACAAVCDRAVVVAKASTALPDGVERWDEPESPRHPLTGIVAALERAGEDVLVLAADLPLLRPEDLRPLVDGGPGLRWAEGEPLCAVYPHALLPRLRAAAGGAPLRRTVEALGPRRVVVPRERLLNVNTPEDLARAAAALVPPPSG
jgi:molybdopterin-guanine dinucleotide biosynthesis protein A